MPNFGNYFDLFNTTSENFNTTGVKCINEEVKDTYEVCSYCRICIVEFEKDIPPCMKDPNWNNQIWVESSASKRKTVLRKNGCRWRAKLSKGPKEKNQYYILQSIGIPNNPNSIILRRAQFYWCYDNKVPVLIRGTRHNKLTIHHINRIAHDDRKGNHAMVRRHEKKHGIITSLETSMKSVRQLYDETKDPRTKIITKTLSKTLRLFESDMEDSPLVWDAIYINMMLIDGKISENECHDMLAEIDMAPKRGEI